MIEIALLGARIEPLYAEQAKARQDLARRRGGEWLAPRGANHSRGKAAEQAAKAVGSKLRSVERAKVVITKGTPELAAAVNAGKLDVKAAASFATKPAEEQRDLVRRVVEGTDAPIDGRQAGDAQ